MMYRSTDPLENLKNDLRRMQDKIRSLELTPRLQNASISKGALRILSDEGLIVEGSAKVTGRLTGSGTFDWTGDMDLQGSQTISGPTTFTGNMDIEGNVSLTGDMTVSGGGTIKAGAITIDPSSNGGSVKFAGGPEIYASGATLGLYSTGTGGWVELDNDGARLHNGARSVQVTDTGFRLAGLPSRSGTGLPTGAIGADVDGTLWRAA